MSGKKIVAYTLLAVVLLMVVIVPLSTQQGGGVYDAWLDYNDDGIIDAKDLHSLGQSYGTLGDSTKNMNITNWPLDAAGNIKVINEYRMLDLQLLDNAYISTWGSMHFYVDVRGYKTVYVGVKHEGGSGQISTTINFIVGSVNVYTGAYVTVTPATAKGYNMSSVIGPELDIFVFETGGVTGAYVSVGIYAVTS